ncbi:MAG: cytochrome P450, partial [Halieaceae bacterium]|nr:cytochrome P450 [Halieaceae bacterium]
MNAESGNGLEKSFANVADNYRGDDVDFYAIFRDMRANSPIIAEDFMSKYGVPNIAGHDADRPTFTLFRHADVKHVLRDAENFTSGFIAEG